MKYCAYNPERICDSDCSAWFVGFGGYQDAMIGISFTFEYGLCVGTFKGTWSRDPSEHAEWTKQDQKNILGETMLFIADLLDKAKVTKVEELKGKPVEVTIKDNALDSWRILEEVL